MSRLDAYIESVMSRMGLEEPQHAQIEKELRAPLDQMVEAGLTKGLTREQAEDQAIRAANQSSFLFKYFGIVQGQRWAYFEYIALLLNRGILLWPLLLCIIITRSYEHMRDHQLFFLLRNFLFFLVFVVIISGISVFLQMFKRVEIRGGLDVRRFLRKLRLIPFDKIKRVRFHHLPFLRINRIVVETADQHAVLDPEFNGFSVAALALNAFASDKIDKDVQQYLTRRKKRIKVRRESPSVRLILTFLWALILICLFIFMWPLWNGFGFSLPFVGILLVGGTLISLQEFFHKESVKRGLCELLCISFLLCTGILIYSVIGDFSLVRWLLVWVIAMFIGGVLLPWWRWSRALLIGIFAFCAVLILSSRYLFPSFYYKDLKPLTFEATSEVFMNLHIGGSEGPIVWIDEYHQGYAMKSIKVLKAAHLNGDLHSIKLEKPGEWWLTLPSPLGEPCVVRTIKNNDKQNVELHIYNQHLSEIKKILPLSSDTDIISLWYPTFPIWSPDGRYLITWLKHQSETYKPRLQAVDIHDGSVTEFEGYFFPLDWIDNISVVGQTACEDELHDDEAANVKRECIELWRFDVEHGSRELLLHREFGENEECEVILPGLKYAFVAYYETLPTPDKWYEQPPDSCYIRNIETGESLSVPILGESQSIFLSSRLKRGWNEGKETLVYLTMPENKDKQHQIAVVDLRARNIVVRGFPNNEEIKNIALSPDGSKMLLIRTMENDPLLPGFSRLDLWDLDKDEIVLARSLGSYELRLRFGLYPIWSPDSTWFAYPFTKPEISALCHTVEVVKVP